MSAVVRNNAPQSIFERLSGYRQRSSTPLTLPLNAQRSALVAAFEARHNCDIRPLLLDALDDIIFDTGRRPSGADSRQPDDTTPPSTQRTA